MTDEIDWDSTSWRENRRRQHQEFLALTFREKMKAIEAMAEVAEFFADRRRARASGTTRADGG
jgi:hypothetical protein